jgi:hypothetical protein
VILITNLRPIDESFNHISFLIFVVFNYDYCFNVPKFQAPKVLVEMVEGLHKVHGTPISVQSYEKYPT